MKSELKWEYELNTIERMDGVRFSYHSGGIFDEAAATEGRLRVRVQVYRPTDLHLATRGKDRTADISTHRKRKAELAGLSGHYWATTRFRSGGRSTAHQQAKQGGGEQRTPLVAVLPSKAQPLIASAPVLLLASIALRLFRYSPPPPLT